MRAAGEVLNSKFIAWLRSQAGPQDQWLVGYAVLAGLLQSLVLVVINHAAGKLSDGGVGFRDLGLFVLCMAGYIYFNKYAVSRTQNIVGRLIQNTRAGLVDRLRKASLKAVEDSEKSQIQQIMVESTDIFYETARAVINAVTGVAMLVASSLYIATMSLPAFLFAVGLNVVGVYIYMATQRKVNQNLGLAKTEEAGFLGLFEHLLGGIAEVKMDRARSDDLAESWLKPAAGRARRFREIAENYITNNIIFAQAFVLILVGAIIFILPQISPEAPGVLLSIVAAVFFIMGPLGNVVVAVPMVAKSDYAVASIHALEEYLDQADDSSATGEVGLGLGEAGFHHLELGGVTFAYNSGTTSSFVLGPLDLEVEAGEVVFLVGGNGSGKTTLLKIMAGLYYPDAGQIKVDGVGIGPSNYAHYRELFALITSQFHLFDRLYGQEPVDVEHLEELLATMQISDVVAYVDGRFTTLKLSAGQRKRLALANAYLEDKPIFLMDEVAADLDPQFRRYFYRELLPALRAKGKTVIAVSHDDRFYDVADRVIKMDFGRMVDAGQQAEGPAC